MGMVEAPLGLGLRLPLLCSWGGKKVHFFGNCFFFFFNLLTRFQGFTTAKILSGSVSGCLTGYNLLFSKQSTISETAQNSHLQLSGGFFSPASHHRCWAGEFPPFFPPKGCLLGGVLPRTEARGGWTHPLPHGCLTGL